MLIYPVIFTEAKDEKDTVLVFIPDLNGMTEGYGLANAISMAKDYIGNALFNKTASEYPKASEIDDIKPETTVFKDAGKSFVSLVDIDVDFYRRKNKSKYVRRNITLPEWLDDMATNEKINVSAVTQKALIQYLGLV
jgi:uncharacterized protein YcsI (UPF0317 family)